MIVVGGCVKPSFLRLMWRGTADCPFRKIPPTSTLSEESITCISNLHSVCIGPFASGGRCGDFLGSDG